MKKEQVLELVVGLETADELRDFAKETLGLNIPHNAGADTVRNRIIEHVNGESEPKKTPEEDKQDEPEADKQDETPKPEGIRQLKNTKNGRVFSYTKQLAKLKHMKEI